MPEEIIDIFSQAIREVMQRDPQSYEITLTENGLPLPVDSLLHFHAGVMEPHLTYVQTLDHHTLLATGFHTSKNPL